MHDDVGPRNLLNNIDRSSVFIRINTLGAVLFSKGGGATITDKKIQLSSPVAMGDKTLTAFILLASMYNGGRA